MYHFFQINDEFQLCRINTFPWPVSNLFVVLGAFLLTWFSFNPSMHNNITFIKKYGMKIHSPNSTVQPLKFVNG